MLAPNSDPLKDPLFFEGLRYPLLGSPKLDGIRCITKEDRCKSRSYKDLPSDQVQELFSKYPNLDGEIIAGTITNPDVYNRTQSYVMSKDKWHDQLTFNVFDNSDEDLAHIPFIKRLEVVRKYVKDLEDTRIQFVEHTLITNEKDLLIYEEATIKRGFEGVMLRDPLGRYKHGRGTYKEGLIYKLKRFHDDEGVVVDFIEKETNLNEKLTDELGHAKRSSHQENKIGAGTLGKFIVNFEGQLINVAVGSFSHPEAQFIWDHRDFYKNKIIKFRHMTHGAKDAPRHARAVGWRTLDDM